MLNYHIAVSQEKTESIGETRKSEQKMKAIIFGAPGSGKGTYASRLQDKLDVNVIATGDIFREIMK